MAGLVSTEVKSGFGELSKRMRRFQSRVQGDLLNRVSQRIAKQARDRVRSSKQSPDGVAWPPRVGGRGNHGLLTKSRTLLRSIRAVREGKDTINVGSDVSYAPFLNKGTRRMAQREFLGVGSTDIANIQSLIDAWVARRF